MGIQINRKTIKAFILDELSGEMLSLVSNAILTDERLAKIFEEEKFKIDIKRYHDNEMTPTQRLEFESRQIKELKFSVEVNQNEEKNNSSDELPLRRKLDEAHSTYKSSQKQHSNAPRKYSINRRFKYWLAAATIVMLIISGEWINYNLQPSDSLENSLYTEYYKRLGPEDFYLFNNNSLDIAKQKYVDGEYSNAILLLRDIPSTINVEVEKNFFIGLSMMEIGRYNVALGYYNQALSSQSDFNLIPQTRWYLGLCYLKIGDRKKAIDTFQTIVDRNDYNYKQAKKILKKLRD
ncbi:MAG: tetratricopeptide repeat protein [Bacteroidales bacterium]|nr:tetratricopeptide repeat protein [Bacteroidales bacterium]